MLRKEDSLRTEIQEIGNSKHRLYVFNCSRCDSEIGIRSGRVEAHTGVCFDCSNVFKALRPFESKYNFLVSRHVKRSYPGDPITYDEYVGFSGINSCHYCNEVIDWFSVRNPSKNKKSNSVNLDRVDNSLGYSAGNLVVCCSRCNFFKSSHVSYDAMLEIGPILAKHKTGSFYRGGRSGPVKKITIKQRSKIIHRSQSSRNKNGFRGVHKDIARNLFISKAKLAGRIIFLGRFSTPEEAAKAYDKWAIETHGEFANLNFPITQSAN